MSSRARSRSRSRSGSPKTKSKKSRVTKSPTRKTGGKKRSATSKSKSQSSRKSSRSASRSRKSTKSNMRSPSPNSKRVIAKAVHQAEEVEHAVERMRQKEKEQPGFLKRWYTKLVGKPGSTRKMMTLASSVVTLLGVLALSASYYNPEMGAQIQELITQFKSVIANAMSSNAQLSTYEKQSRQAEITGTPANMSAKRPENWQQMPEYAARPGFGKEVRAAEAAARKREMAKTQKAMKLAKQTPQISTSKPKGLRGTSNTQKPRGWFS